MHPQIQLPKAGQCPICFMPLVPVGSSGEGAVLRLSEAAKALAQIETAPVERKFVAAEVRMVGKVEYDESRVRYVTARFPGRLDRLYVDYTGVPVKKGEHLVSMYSPDLLTAQEELLHARRAARAREDNRSAHAALAAAREKLRLWGLTAGQVAAIETRGAASDHLTITSPISGIVTHKNVFQGVYVKEGTRIYTVVDLSRVWVKLDAYESDLPFLRHGQAATFEAEAVPGRTFNGTIALIDPVLDDRTRTVKVRVNVPNPDGKLKPDMFVRAVVRPRIAEGGRVLDNALAGKWTCSMHPDVVRDGRGDCPQCDMPLVRAESLGYAQAGTTKARPPLVVPASAPLVTGKRAVVYVAVPGAEEPTYEGRQVRLGPRLGNHYVVASGLKEGERVVVRGNFKIDSALQIEARPSMMTPASDGPAAGAASRRQTHCPVMGGEIDPKVFVDHKGMRIYFCCPGCDTKFKKDPEAYIAKMRKAGVEPERVGGGKSP
jgi:Cu(I)/Ag(I) efflux system membrane fusion protein